MLFADSVVSEDCVSDVPSEVEGASAAGIVSSVVAASPEFSPIEVSVVGGAGEVRLLAGVIIIACFALVVTFNCRFFDKKKLIKLQNV